MSNERIHPPVPSDQLLTGAQAARLAGCSVMTMYLAMKDGRVGVVRLGSIRYVPVSEALAFADRVQMRGVRVRMIREREQQKAVSGTDVA